MLEIPLDRIHKIREHVVGDRVVDLRIGLGQLGQRHLVEGTNLLRRAQGGEDPPSSISMAQMRSRVLITNRPIATMFYLAMAARIAA